ncbi:MAG TPA: DNA primase [Vicinamibacterales bacterium]|jgi:DNA primase|nr:DNA primase [Vicinamibacterales bacterium]
MALFPQRFIDDLKQQADIVVVIQDYVSLKKAGATYKGLCPFHGEKTPSFQVHRDKGFFHCFGCGVGGDVIKFLELHEKVGFTDAVKQLAQRFGVAIPELEQSDDQRASTAERETLLKIHEAAAAWFREQLAAPAGTRIRNHIASRGISTETSAALGLGFAPPGWDALKRTLIQQGFTESALVRAGLLSQREDGSTIDRFRNRLMIPICRDNGSVIAFGGRALDADQQPKYLNSPETPIYSKGRTLYGLNLAKNALRQRGFAVLVEGYFDFAQVYQAGMQGVVASCGTALTPQQAQQLRRFTSKVVLSFDPDAAGQGAAAKSCEMLVAEGFEVNVATLPQGDDPDTFVRKNGGQAYGERLQRSQPYLEYLLDRAAAGHNLNSDEGRVNFLNELLPVAGRIPDAARRDRFADRLSHKARVTEDVVRAQIRQAVSQKQTTISARELPNVGQVTKAEKGLIWLLVHNHNAALTALESLEPMDLKGLSAGSVLDLARKLNEDRGFSPAALLERLTMAEANLVTAIASEREPHVHDAEGCTRIIRRLRCEREYAELQREIDRLQELGAKAHGSEIDALWARKLDLKHRMEGLI